MVYPISDFEEVYLKTNKTGVHISNDEGVGCSSDSNGFGGVKSRPMKPIDRRSVTNESKASVYFTPNDSVDQPQLQLSPMHINIIQENLNTFPDCMKPSEAMCKFDFDMHRLEANLELEIDRRRHHISSQPDDDDDEIIEIDTEKTRMLNNSDDRNDDDMAINSSQGYIRLNTIPRHNKYKRTASGNDFYYSLESMFEPATVHSNHYQKHLSNKTVDKASYEETQLTSSGSDNCSSNEMNRSNPTTDEYSQDNRHPSQSVLVLNNVSTGSYSEIQTSNSMPNISKTDNSVKEPKPVSNTHFQLDQMLPN